MELFVPDSPALRVPVKGFSKDADGIIVFWGTVGIKPARGPQIFWEANPGSRATGEVDARLNVGLMGVPSGGPGTLKCAGSNRTVSCGHVAGARADFLI
jgi:hypothetical protein